MAKAYKYDTSLDALLHPAKNAAFFEEWKSEDTRNHDLLCAEMSRLAYADQDVVGRALQRIEFQLTSFLGGEDLPERFNTHGTQGFVANNSKERLTVLAFRGTESDKLQDIAADAMTLPIASSLFSGCRIHEGFEDRFRAIQEILPSPISLEIDSLLITGHSLGAALATLAAAQEKPAELITFGSPLVGDSLFCRLFGEMEIHRHVDCCDVVARVPPGRFDQEHVPKLLGELCNTEVLKPPFRELAERVIEGAASVVTGGFTALDPGIEYAHVSPGRYISADGTRSRQITVEQIAQDQRSARAAYAHRLTASQLAEILREFASVLRAGSIAIQDFFRRLSEVANNGQVPLRDLSDHAPINYVSAFSGRV